MSEAPVQRGWRELLHLSALGLILTFVFAQIFLIDGIEPVVVILTVLLLVGLFLSLRGSRGGDITLVVIVLLASLLNLPFTLPNLMDLESTVQFVLALLFLLSAITGIVASIQVLRRRPPTQLVVKWMWTALVLFVVLSGVSTVVRLTSTQAEAQPGDLKLTAENVEYSPTDLSVDAGEISVFLNNKDLSSHTFTIEDLDVDQELPGDSQKRVTFNAQPGTYEFHCTISGHESMKGTLTVG